MPLIPPNAPQEHQGRRLREMEDGREGEGWRRGQEPDEQAQIGKQRKRRDAGIIGMLVLG